MRLKKPRGNIGDWVLAISMWLCAGLIVVSAACYSDVKDKWIIATIGVFLFVSGGLACIEDTK